MKIVLIICFLYAQASYAMLCGAGGRVLNSFISSKSPLIVISLNHSIYSLEELRSHKYRLISGKESHTLRVIDATQNFGRIFISLQSKDVFEGGEYEFVTMDKNDKPAMKLKNNLLKVRKVESEEPGLIKITNIEKKLLLKPILSTGEERLVYIHTSSKNKLIRLSIKNSKDMIFHSYHQLETDGLIAVGVIACKKDFLFEMNEAYRVTVQLVGPTGKLGPHSNEIEFNINSLKDRKP